jgi:hypothetical protein
MGAPVEIKNNIDRLKEKLSAAALRSGRKPEEIQLMAVSKFHPVSSIQAAYDGGIRLFGENRIQETLEKFTPGIRDSLAGAELSMIGTLQRNKINKAIAHFDSIQSVDSLELLAGILERVSPREKALDIYLELHTGEASKSGFCDASAIFHAIDYFLEWESRIASQDKNKRCELKGLMTMAPFTDDKSMQRKAFKSMRATLEAVNRRCILPGFSMLSMGMSNDFETAIEEGSTLVRIGTAIFGQRP